MKTWIIEPRDPLIVRDGRPFGPTPGARARTLPFPFPSTIAGGARTKAGRNDAGRFDSSQETLARVLSYEVRGPFLVELDNDGEVQEWFFPAPADALMMGGGAPDFTQRYRLSPISLPSGAHSNMRDDLYMVGLTQKVEGKAAKYPPSFWRWRTLESWLLDPESDDSPKLSATLGIAGPTRETRMHVSVQHETQTAEEGALFQTQGLEFVTPIQPQPSLSTVTTLALAIQSDAELQPGVAPLGGERRIMRWRESKKGPASCPDTIAHRIAASGACRVVLATPAYVEDVLQPQWLLTPRDGVTPRLRALAVQRPQIVSGWDMAKPRDGKGRGMPKPSRRLAPAGTVFWLELAGERAAREAWVRNLWLKPISDDNPSPDTGRGTAQFRQDGFGVALLGTWDGRPTKMEQDR